MNRNLKVLTVLGTLILVTACGGGNYVQNQQTQNAIAIANDNLGTCVQNNVDRRQIAQCASQFHSAISVMPSNDYGKPAALSMATSLYSSFLKYDRRQIDKQDVQGDIMRISSQFSADLEAGRRRTVQENMEATRIRQQAWRDISEALKPPQFITPVCPGMLNAKPGQYGPGCN